MLATGVLLVWVLLGVIAAAGVAWWARRLWTRREELSLGAKALAALVALTLIVAALGTVESIAKAFIAVDGEALEAASRAGHARTLYSLDTTPLTNGDAPPVHHPTTERWASRNLSQRRSHAR
jgi:hypothetical protein